MSLELDCESYLAPRLPKGPMVLIDRHRPTFRPRPKVMRAKSPQRLPDFLVIGAMKCGTTTLHHDLSAVSGIFMPLEKEPECLCWDAVLLPAGRESYARHYWRSRDDQLCGDASTAYSKLPEHQGVPQRAEKLLGSSAKIVYLMRDPIERLLSQHRHEHGAGLMGPDVNKAVNECPRLVSYSCYRMQLEPWMATFGRENIRVETFERFVAERETVLKELLQFLGATGDIASVDFSKKYNTDPRRAIARPLDKLISSRPYKEWGRRFIPASARTTIYRSLWASRELERPIEMSADCRTALLDVLRPQAEWVEAEFEVDLRCWSSMR